MCLHFKNCMLIWPFKLSIFYTISKPEIFCHLAGSCISKLLTYETSSRSINLRNFGFWQVIYKNILRGMWTFKKLDSYAFTLMCIKIWLHQPMILLLRSRLSIKKKIQLIKRNILSKKEKIFRGYKDTVKNQKNRTQKVEETWKDNQNEIHMDSWNFIKVVLAVLSLQDKVWSHEGNLLSDAWLPNFGYKRHNSHPISSSFPPAEEELATATAHPNVNCTLTNWTGTLSPEVSQDHTLASQVLPFPARQATLGSLPSPQAPLTWMH